MSFNVETFSPHIAIHPGIEHVEFIFNHCYLEPIQRAVYVNHCSTFSVVSISSNNNLRLESALKRDIRILSRYDCTYHP